MSDTNPLAANWIRTAVDAIVDRAAADGNLLPAEKLEAFVMNRKMDPKARRLAYELLLKADPSAKRLVPGFLDDPSVELRRDAVDLVIAEAGRVLKRRARRTKRPAFTKRPSMQRGIATKSSFLAGLLKKRDREPDLASHFGFVRDWKVIGPFDNTDEKGFDVVYPPGKRTEGRRNV